MEKRRTKSFLTIVFLLVLSYTMAQESPLKEIPPYPESYSEGTIVARFLEGLGYRYYWATEGLKEDDLIFRPHKDARSIHETLIHLYSLTRFINDTVHGDTIQRTREYVDFNAENLRKSTLEMIQQASTALRTGDFVPHPIVFPPTGEGVVNELPFWNLLNGPISDALYHTGQVVMLRRINGNPINPKVNVFMGKTGK